MIEQHTGVIISPKQIILSFLEIKKSMLHRIKLNFMSKLNILLIGYID